MYRRQHKALLEIASRFPRRHSVVGEGRVRMLLLALTANLRAHVTLQDERLYPALLNHESEQVRDVAARCKLQMAELMTIYDTFYQRWNAAGAITGDPLGFVQQWAAMVNALAVHAAREENELYDLVDRTPDLTLA